MVLGIVEEVRLRFGEVGVVVEAEVLAMGGVGAREWRNPRARKRRGTRWTAT